MRIRRRQHDDLSTYRECHDCGLVQQVPDLPDGEVAVCGRCDAILRRANVKGIPIARACVTVAALLFTFALISPFVDLHVLGRYTTSTLFTGPKELGQRGMAALAVVVFMTLIAMPALKITLLLMVLWGMMSPRPSKFLPWIYGWYGFVSPWAMVEVFLLGAFIAYTRLRAMAAVSVGPCIIALFGVMLLLVAIDATLDREAIWRTLQAKGARLSRKDMQTEEAEGWHHILGCHACYLVSRARDGESCRRCGHHLHFRKRGSLGRTWALLIGATLLYIPANVLPVMTVLRLGKGGPTTIMNGVVELAEAHLYPLAGLVLLASVVVPMIKLVSMVMMLVLTHRKSDYHLKHRAKLYRFVHAIGRWSMIDIFMLATLVGVVRLGFLSTVLPGMGAMAFCGVVLITMVATDMFDPRLMWDAAEERAARDDRVITAVRKAEST